jgi:uncharacterized oligopeptide transporter (OPT) family protein
MLMPQHEGIRIGSGSFRRTVGQIALGCLLALACAYLTGLLGFELPGLGLTIVFVAAIVLAILVLKPWNRRRVGRIQ